MRNFPTICVDDFYTDPDAVRNFALEQDFCYSSPEWPGRRTKNLDEISPIFFQSFCKKLFSIYYDLEDREITWKVRTNFQLVKPYSEDENSPKNVGCIHRDDWQDIDGSNIICAGIIYLTPKINRNCGTSIFKRINYRLNDTTAKQDLYGNNIDTGFDQVINEQDQQFEETARFYNYYNRLVSFDASSYHGVNSFYSDEPRLTQPFFVCYINSDQKYPLTRCAENNIL